ncbi:MAG TPA: SPOR domain-containing protein [Sphingomonas sp.]
MSRLTRACALLAFGLAAALAGCAHKTTVVELAPSPESIPPRPALPAYLGAIVPPAIGADGNYQTINHGIDPLQAMWHVRAALNVAAIGCRGADNGAALATAYNGMLTHHRALLATANKSVEANFRARFGASAWQKAHDAYMTRLYNFFATPAAKPGFCAAAAPLATQAAATPPGQFATFTASALPQLEAPFIEVFRQVDGYHEAVAAWDARYGPGATRAAPPVEAATTSPTRSAAPRLAYVDMARLVAWEAPRGTALASN